MKIVIGTDHAGYRLKEIIKDKLKEWGYEIMDVGTNSEESVDYPEYARTVAETVASGNAERGIAICGNGLGATYVANKIPGIRAAMANTELLARQSRQHGDSNVLSLGGRPETGGLQSDQALAIVKVWLTTDFEGGRHARRIDQIRQIEQRYLKS